LACLLKQGATKADRLAAVSPTLFLGDDVSRSDYTPPPVRIHRIMLRTGKAMENTQILLQTLTAAVEKVSNASIHRWPFPAISAKKDIKNG
jgi:hypothetical protein